jgi:hypothetical protein
VLVDEKDLSRIQEAGPWFVYPRATGGFYVLRNIRQPGKHTTERLHRFMLQVKTLEVDHINGNGLDNRRQNLRLVTHTLNQHNAGRRTNNSSGHQGIDFPVRIGKWRVRIQADKRSYCVGYFHSFQSCGYPVAPCKI